MTEALQSLEMLETTRPTALHHVAKDLNLPPEVGCHVVFVPHMRGTGSPFVNKGRLRGFLKDPLLNSCKITQLEHKPAKNNDRNNRTLSFKRTYI
jgi:hypothetical protein